MKKCVKLVISKNLKKAEILLVLSVTGDLLLNRRFL